MIKVSNQKVIRRISLESLKAGRLKNLVAITAITLTTALFTALFTILLSVVEGYEAQNFRQIGTYSHGEFKYLSAGQVQDFAVDNAIREYGLRRYVGMAIEDPFHKKQVEISYCDANMARWMFLEPVEGSLPREGTREAAASTLILSLLGVEPAVGTEFTMSFDVDGTAVTETFVLSGYWESDPVSVAEHVLIPLSRAEEIFEKYEISSTDGMTGTWGMGFMLQRPFRLMEEVSSILERHGYQTEDSMDENYIPTGINWGYVSTEMLSNIDFMLVLALAVMLALIGFTGYLIIYNVFRISVANDIRFYGMLKTIGTTGRQLKRIIRQQAFCLSAAGIPLGLLLGWGVGCGLTGLVIGQLDNVQDQVSADIRIFLGAALFSLLTVSVSCRRPGRLAASVSPVEAVRYTECDTPGKRINLKRTGKGASLPGMAWANLGRSRSRTAVTMISLSLSLVLLNITVTLAKGFDMDKYLRDIKVDFLVGDASYFQHPWDPSMGVSEELIGEITKQGGIAAGGRAYGTGSSYSHHVYGENSGSGMAFQYVTEEVYRDRHSSWGQESLRQHIETEPREQGMIQDGDIKLSGLEPFLLDHLEVVEGDLSKLYGEGDYAAVVDTGMNPVYTGPGDKVLIQYTAEMEYYNPNTGEVYPGFEAIGTQPYRARPKNGRLVEYEIAAVVKVPTEFSYRYWSMSGQEFIMNAETFREHSGTDSVMYYAFDMEEGGAGNPADSFSDGEGGMMRENGKGDESGTGEDNESRMESFLADYTENVDSRYSYESKAVFAENFDSMRSMYLICGGVLSFIVGMVGVLNFVNVILTGVLSRRRELAVLQSVGMTGKQLKVVLIMEGIYYTLGAVMITLSLSVVSAPLVSRMMSGMFWFFTYHFTIVPILVIMPMFALLGFVIPLAAYRFLSRHSIVERLREAEA